jgi:hypothetical protein
MASYSRRTSVTWEIQIEDQYFRYSTNASSPYALRHHWKHSFLSHLNGKAWCRRNVCTRVLKVHVLNINFFKFFFLICIVGGGVQTGSTRHFGHLLAYCTCTGWLWGWRILWNEWQGKPKYSEKTFPGATLSTTNPTWPDPGLNSGRRGGKPATNRFSYGPAYNISTLLPVIVIHVCRGFSRSLQESIKIK